MSWFWIIYFVSLGVVILFTALVKILFTYNGEEFHISHVIMTDFIAAIPAVGTIIGFILVCLIFASLIEGDLEPKYE